MNEHRIVRYCGILATIIFIGNFYVFSRFTVDDAFITWRYGQNLVEYGVWGYNPVEFDVTQAYTNPLYAALSVIPAYFGMDAVLFFKVFGILILAFFILSFTKSICNRTIGLSAIAFLFASPSLTIHTFSGLETFAYAAFLGLALIGIERQKYIRSTLYIVLAVLCRPEAWLWAALLPISILAIEAHKQRLHSAVHPTPFLKAIKLKTIKRALVGVLPGIVLAIMLLLHKAHFGYFLPNTFYVKSASGATFDPVMFAFLAVLGLSPLAVAIMAGRRFVPLVIVIYFLPVIYSYSSSDLQMNYNWRFAFQIFVPTYIYSAYVSAAEMRIFRLINVESPLKVRSIHAGTWFVLLLGSISAMYTLQTNRASELVHLANYYPRALDSHAALGRVLNQIHGQPGGTAFLLGDAGMAAFHSRTVALDNVGLGSALVAHNGVTDEILDEYHLQYVFLHANPDTGIWQRFGYQQIQSWMRREQFNFVCDIFWKRDYVLRYFARVPSPLIQEVCLTSREANEIDDRDYFLAQASRFPWAYWRE